MFRRISKFNKSNSLFVFGARGVGKSTWIREQFHGPKVLWIDLLKGEVEERFRKNPSELSSLIEENHYEWVVIDEIQKLPAILDRVHFEIENPKSNTKFVLTGSSARKLKRGGANMLAGRAFTHFMFPLSFEELDKDFELQNVLSFGTLPQLYSFTTKDNQIEYLNNYVSTYLNEEIIAEQIVRQIQPFKDFLKISAQMNGQLINYSKIANDIGVDDKTVRSYYDILEDTLVGFYLRPHHQSIRKRQRESSKFYLFDTGIKRALEKTVTLPLEPQTYAYGNAFEHRIILEVFYKNLTEKFNFELSFLRTKDSAEIDLIIERPGLKTLLVEIKSNKNISEKDTKSLEKFMIDWPTPCEAQVWSLDSLNKKVGQVRALFWKDAILEAFHTVHGTTFST
jgi:predicted AAA+ superfamily ATPase